MRQRVWVLAAVAVIGVLAGGTALSGSPGVPTAFDGPVPVDVPAGEPLDVEVVESWHFDGRIVGEDGGVTSGTPSDPTRSDVPRAEDPPVSDLTDPATKDKLREAILARPGQDRARQRFGLRSDSGVIDAAAHVPAAELWAPGLLMGLVVWGEDADSLQKQMLVAQAAEALVPAVRERLGESFAAMWIDHESGGSVHIAGSSQGLLDGAVEFVARELGVDVDGAVVDWTEQQLLDLADIAKSKIPPADRVDTVTDTIGGRVLVRVVSGRDAAARDAVEGLPRVIVEATDARAGAD